MIDRSEKPTLSTSTHNAKPYPRQKRIYVLNSQCYELRLNATCQVPVLAEQYDRYSYFYTTPSNRCHAAATVGPNSGPKQRSREQPLQRWWSSVDSFLDTLQRTFCPESKDVKSSSVLTTNSSTDACKRLKLCTARYLMPVWVSDLFYTGVRLWELGKFVM